jgi:hypothetical protein
MFPEKAEGHPPAHAQPEIGDGEEVPTIEADPEVAEAEEELQAKH